MRFEESEFIFGHSSMKWLLDIQVQVNNQISLEFKGEIGTEYII